MPTSTSLGLNGAVGVRGTNTEKYGFSKPTPGSDNNTWGEDTWTGPGDTSTGLNGNFDIIEYYMFDKVNGDAITGPIDVNGGGTITGEGTGDTVTITTTAHTYTFGSATETDDDVMTRSEVVALVNAMRIPVGGLYMSASDTDPATTLGYGTWAAHAAGRALVGVGSASGLDWDVGDLKGDDRRTLSEANLPSHTHSCNSTGSHTHSVDPGNTTTTSGGSHSHSVDPGNTTTTSNGSHSHTSGSYATNSKTVSGTFTINRGQSNGSND